MDSLIKDLLDDNDIKIPKHIAIICDGNGRCAKKKGLPRTFGHKAGIKPIENILSKKALKYKGLVVYGKYI